MRYPVLLENRGKPTINGGKVVLRSATQIEEGQHLLVRACGEQEGIIVAPRLAVHRPKVFPKDVRIDWAAVTELSPRCIRGATQGADDAVSLRMAQPDLLCAKAPH